MTYYEGQSECDACRVKQYPDYSKGWPTCTDCPGERQGYLGTYMYGYARVHGCMGMEVSPDVGVVSIVSVDILQKATAINKYDAWPCHASLMTAVRCTVD